MSLSSLSVPKRYVNSNDQFDKQQVYNVATAWNRHTCLVAGSDVHSHMDDVMIA